MPITPKPSLQPPYVVVFLTTSHIAFPQWMGTSISATTVKVTRILVLANLELRLVTRSSELIGKVQLLLAFVETLADSLLESWMTAYSYLWLRPIASEVHKHQSADYTPKTGHGPLKFPKHGVPVNIVLC